MEEEKIIFVDGHCNLCNWFADFVISRDADRKFKFASLQGETSKQILDQNIVENTDSILLYSENNVDQESDAISKVLREMPDGWPIIGFLILPFPRIIRDNIYKFVARNRYRVFGKTELCRVPTEEESGLFLP
tara:strand:- start:133 stop:531 length:399 start_codon:yes stop_codon:yes gene_type:complete